MRGLLYGVLFYAIGQALTWFQTNGQFMWPLFRKNQILVSVIGGTAISWLFIEATRLIAEYNNGLVWPGRFIGFSVGIFVFAIMTNYFLGEGVNAKTLVSLLLAFVLIAVQLFWK
jgi:hypothetical protein